MKRLTTALRAAAGWPLRAFGRLMGWAVENPPRCALWAFVGGFCLCLVAIYMGVGFVSFGGRLWTGHDALAGLAVQAPPGEAFGKEVGYLFAPNWSLFGVVVVPTLVWFGLVSLGATKTAIETATGAGMVRDGSFRALGADEVVAAWEKHQRENVAVFAVMFVLVMGFMLTDWWTVVGHPLLDPYGVKARLDDVSMEYDWSVSSLFAPPEAAKWPLLAFGFLAYVLLAGFMPAFAFAVVISSLHFVSFVYGAPRWRKQPWRLAALPTQDPADRLLGFDCFAEFFNALLLAGLCVLVGLIFMVLQNAYLRDATSHDIIDFVVRDTGFVNQMLAFEKKPAEIMAWLAEPAPFRANNQAAFSVLLFPFVCVVAIGASWLLLRRAAMQARDFSLAHLEALARETGQTVEGARASLKRMKFWPVGWMQLNELLLLMLILMLCMVSYRLILAPVVWLVGVVLGQFWQTVKRRFGRTAEA